MWQKPSHLEGPDSRSGHHPETAAGTHKFAFSPNQLYALLNARASDFRAIGALPGLCAGLRTDPKAGISLDETDLDDVAISQDAFTTVRPWTACLRNRSTVAHPQHTKPRKPQSTPFSDRRRVFGENRLPKPKQKSIWALIWTAFNNKLMYLLVASALASLVFGISQAVILGNSKGSNTGWVESATIIGAIFATVMATAANDYQKNYRFQQLNQRKDERWVMAIRSGRSCKISAFDLVVGDLVRVETGDIPSADGVLVDAFQMRCNESHLFGESELVHKIPAEQYHCGSAANPFIFSGSIVSQGVGTYLVTAVGTNSTTGRIAMSLRNENEITPLQQKLGRLAKYIINVSSIVGIIYFFALFIRWAVQLNTSASSSSPRVKGEAFLNIFMLAVTVVIIGVPEGLSLAVAVALAFATTHMWRENNLVRLLRSCEVMGNATTICSDKTGTLTRNEMSVASGIIGCNEKFASGNPISPAAASDNGGDEGEGNFIPASNLTGELARDVESLLRSSITLNSTALELEGSGSSRFVGSSTETALLKFAREHLSMGALTEERSNANVVEIFPFDAERKFMAVIVKMGVRYRMLVKGAAEIIIDNCVETLEDTNKTWNPREELISAALGSEQRQELQAAAQFYSRRLLRTIAMAYRDLESWPPIAALGSWDDPNDSYANLEQVFRHQMTFVSMFALHDPLRPEVVDSISRCQQAGVFVRMLTGDNLAIATAIARESGIYTAGGIAMDGPIFRRLTPDQIDSVAPRLQVLARSNADDKAKLVMSLKRLGETVAVTGDGTNDAFALKAADIAFSMGASGTEVAKAASSIVLMDDNFASIVRALSWGRGVTDSTKKYCQFQFTLNISAAIITIISTLVGNTSSSVFDVTQLLWLNLVMDIIAAVSFSTDLPRPYLLRRRPEPRNASLFTIQMWKMILGQSVYQLAVIFTLHYAGTNRFWTDAPEQQVQTVVFNTYMFMQLFNQINCRRVDNGLDVFEGLLSNPWFLGIQVCTFIGQVIIVFKGGVAFGTEPLTGAQWGWCIIFGLFVLPIGAAIRCFPDDWAVAAVHTLKPLVWPIGKAVQLARRRKVEQERKLKQRKQKGTGPFEAAAEEAEVQQNKSISAHELNAVLDVKPRTPSREPNTNTASAEIGGIARDASELAPDGDGMNDDGPFDLFSAVEASKNKIADRAVAGIHVHPETEGNDPVLVPPAPLKRGRQNIPPSQNWEIMRYMGIHRRRERRDTDL